MQWYLISKETVEAIREALAGEHLREDEALHQLNTGLHTTNVVPDDFKRMIVPKEKPEGSTGTLGGNQPDLFVRLFGLFYRSDEDAE